MLPVGKENTEDPTLGKEDWEYDLGWLLGIMIRQAPTSWSFLTKNPPLLPSGACIQSQVLWTANPSLSHCAPALPPSPGNAGSLTPLSLKALSSRGRLWREGG